MKPLPRLSDEEMRRKLEPPTGTVRVVIDTDTKNEIDDQFALAWALLSQDQLEIEGVYAAPYSFALHQPGLLRAYEIMHANTKPSAADQELVTRYGAWIRNLEIAGKRPHDIDFVPPDIGMEQSYDEILLTYAKLGLDPGDKVYRGSPGYLTSLDAPIRSPAAEHLIECALKADDRPLYVAAIGCITNVVSAILLAPEIIERIVVLWTSAYPCTSKRPNQPSFNLIQDLIASQFLYDCGVPLVYLPGYHVGAQLSISLPEMETWVRGKGAIGDYLYWLYIHNPIHAMRGINDHFGRTWIIWDLINFAWLLNPDWVPSDIMFAPILQDDTTWQLGTAERHLIREAYDIDRDAIYRDFFIKLEQASNQGKA